MLQLYRHILFQNSLLEMKRGSKLLKNIEEIENSNENTKELNDVVVHDHCPFFLSIFNLVFQITMAFYRFLGFRVHRPILSSSEDSYPVDSQPPPTTVDPPIEDPVGICFLSFEWLS